MVKTIMLPVLETSGVFSFVVYVNDALYDSFLIVFFNFLRMHQDESWYPNKTKNRTISLYKLCV